MTLFAILAAVNLTRILFSTFRLAKRKSKLIGLGTVEMSDYSFKRQNLSNWMEEICSIIHVSSRASSCSIFHTSKNFFLFF